MQEYSPLTVTGMDIKKSDNLTLQPLNAVSLPESPSRIVAHNLVKSMNVLTDQYPDMFAVGYCKTLHDLILKWNTEDPQKETDVAM